MTKQPEQQTDPGTGSGSAPETGSAGSSPPPSPTIREQVAEALGSLLSAGKATVGAGAPAGEKAPQDGPQGRGPADARFDVSDQVRKAVADIHESEQRDSMLKGLQEEVATLKKAGEKPPIQERKVERVMGWRLPEER